MGRKKKHKFWRTYFLIQLIDILHIVTRELEIGLKNFLRFSRFKLFFCWRCGRRGNRAFLAGGVISLKFYKNKSGNLRRFKSLMFPHLDFLNHFILLKTKI